jgi:hypothetical protein
LRGMDKWNGISDEDMRAEIRGELSSLMDEWIKRAEHNEHEAAKWIGRFRGVAPAKQFAERCRRQVAHYQQAIDLLTAAPMPPKDEPR